MAFQYFVQTGAKIERMETDSVLLIELGRETLAVARSLGRAGFHVIVDNS
jgi:hypothetical protein